MRLATVKIRRIKTRKLNLMKKIASLAELQDLDKENRYLGHGHLTCQDRGTSASEKQPHQYQDKADKTE